MEHIKVIELPHKSAQGATYTLLKKVNEVVTWINEHDATISISPTGEALASCCTDAIAPALTMNAPAWISVKDRLPEVEDGADAVKVLVYYNCAISHAMEIGATYFWKDSLSLSENGLPGGFELLGVTHWMPLPEPPK